MTEEVGRKFTRVRHLQMLATKIVDIFATKAQLDAVSGGIPTNLSAFTNDANYAKVSQIPTKLSELEDDTVATDSEVEDAINTAFAN